MKTAYISKRFSYIFACLVVFLLAIATHGWSIEIMIVDQVMCTGDNAGMNGKLRVTGISSHPVPLQNIQWSHGPSGPGMTEVDMLMPGSYTVMVTDVSGCMASAMTQLTSEAQVSISGGGERTFCPDDSPMTVQLTAIAPNCTGCLFNWSNGGSGSSITVNASGNFSVTVTTSNGACTDSDQTNVMINIASPDDCDDDPDIDIPIPHAVDPNDITSPLGFGEERWVSVNGRLEYKVRYENDPIFATAPAQVVKIDVPIDDNLNPFSFRVGNLGFGSFTVDVPQNQTFFTTQVDASDSLGVLVNITAGVDITENKYFWILESIDPVTGLPPDPLLGFLPVNDTINRLADTLASPGEGYVTFSALPKSNSITGDTIHAQASIIFDVNDPLLTNIEFNTIDANDPVSNMIPTFLTTDSSAFELSWMGTDIGSGVASYGIWFSQNNGPFQLWTDTLTSTSAVFQGINGTTYDFYSIATDNVGNVEDPKDTPEESIVVEGLLELETPLGGEIFCSYDTIAVSWNSDGIQLIDLSYSVDGGANFTVFADSLDAAMGTYAWPIPSGIPDGDFLIEIITTGGFIADTSASFGIHPIVINPGDDLEICRQEMVTLGGAPATGGFGSLSFDWVSDDGFTSNTANPDHTPSFSDQFILTVTDDAGCFAKDTVDVTVNRLPDVFRNKTNVTCSGSPEGSITLTISNGTLPYDILWNDGDTNLVRNNLFAGNYSVTVTDDKGCQRTQSTLILDLNPFTFSAGDDFILCTGDTVSLGGAPTLLGGAPPHSIEWFPATGLDDNFSSNPSTFTDVDRQYVLTVMDSLNCVFADTVNVTVREKPVLNPVITDILCGDSAEGGIDLAVSGGAAPYNFNWADGSDQEIRTNLENGTYTVSVTDANNCLAEGAFLLTEPPTYTIDAGDDRRICFGDTIQIGSLLDSVVINKVSFQWSPAYNINNPGLMIPSVNPQVDTMYILTTIDTLGCIKMDTMLVDLKGGIEVITNVSQPTCNGGNDGTISLIISEGIPPYNVIWSDGNTDTNRSGLAPGAYSVTVSDSDSAVNPCEFETTITLEQGADVVLNLGPDSGICIGESILLTGMVANPNVTYSWSPANGLSQTDIGNPTATPAITTTYHIIATDQVGGCVAEDSVMVIVNPLPTVDAGSDQTICANESAMLQATGASTYIWSPVNGLNQNDIANPIANPTDTIIYSVTGTDDNNCVASATVTVNVNPLPNVTIDGLQPDYCVNDAPVTLSGTPANGSFTLDGNGVMSFDPSMLSLGTHNVEYTITDVNNCTNTASQNISILSLPVIELGNDTTIVLGEMVILDATIPGGVYEWSDMSNGPTLTVTQTGTYSVTVTNANNCSVTDMIVVNVSSNIALNAMQNSPVVCNGEANGQATISANGGVEPYTYLWDNGETNVTAIMLSGGSHGFTVTDSDGFSAVGSVTINEPAALSASAIEDQPVACNGEANGQATTTPAGGTGTYTYLWDNGETDATAISLDEGMHIVSITDNNGCTTMASVMVTQPDAISGAANEDSAVACNGESNGQATAAPSGGTGPYTYLWDSGETDATAIALNAGIHNVSITDSNGCSAEFMVDITEPVTLSASAVEDQPVACVNDNNGAATVTPAGGVSGYSFMWNNGETTATAIMLSAGLQSATVTDTNGCFTTTSVTIQESLSPLVGDAITDSDVLCNGDATGSATASAFGGTAPYTFLWDSGETSASAIALNAGDHSVSITDDFGCTITQLVTINEPIILGLMAVESNPVTCFGETNGVATSLPTGGTIPYTFLWDNGESDAVATALDAGDHTVTLTDGNGCTIEQTVTITQPDELVTTSVEDQSVLCNGESTGQATATPAGGTMPYTYTWDNAETEATATNLNAGIHSVTVTDANLCEIIATVEITEPSVLIAGMATTPDTGTDNGTAAVIPSGGTQPYTYVWNTDPVQTDSVIVDLDAGFYTATLTDANGCSTEVTVEVTFMIGVEELPTVSSFDIFPNPVQDILNIDIKLHDLHNVVTEIYDDTGRLIEKVGEEALKERLYQLDVKGYAAGVYLVKLTVEGQVVGEQFIVIKY